MKIYRLDGKCNVCGKVVRDAREAMGLSQDQLAARVQLLGLALSQKTISRIETGSRVVADYELVFLAEALGITVYQLLGLE